MAEVWFLLVYFSFIPPQRRQITMRFNNETTGKNSKYKSSSETILEI
jgi:hypothetical protein